MPAKPTITETPTTRHLTLIATEHHDTHSITPLHVTVIRTIATLIGVNPKKTQINLSDHISITLLDTLCNPDYTTNNSSLGFHYTDFNANLYILCHSTGDIYIYERLKTENPSAN
jgi:hypothetical protein